MLVGLRLMYDMPGTFACSSSVLEGSWLYRRKLSVSPGSTCHRTPPYGAAHDEASFA